MGKTVKSEARCQQDLETVIERLLIVIDTENAALERGDGAAILALAGEKREATTRLEALWADYCGPLKNGHEERNRRFAELQPLLKRLGRSLERNRILLTAAKVSTARRIEASIAAWRRAQNDESVLYGRNGASETRTGIAGMIPSQMI